ncbi:MAG: hypothetical protein M3P98_03235 [bacterium]|nr:hypothetical protein [bacterium]
MARNNSDDEQKRSVFNWIFFVLFIIFGVIGIFAYRNNNIYAIELRDEIILVDEQNGDVETALDELRQYTFAHMNAGLGSSTQPQPIQLVHTYERLREAEQDRVSSANEKVVNDAQKFCEKKFPASTSGRSRVSCAQDYISDHGQESQPIQEDFYKFGFVSPIWSPDLAGWSLLASGLFFILFVIRFALNRIFRSRL